MMRSGGAMVILIALFVIGIITMMFKDALIDGEKPPQSECAQFEERQTMSWEIYLLSISDNIVYVTNAAVTVVLVSGLLLYTRLKELTKIDEAKSLDSYEPASKMGWYLSRTDQLEKSIRLLKWLMVVGFIVFVVSLFVPTLTGLDTARELIDYGLHEDCALRHL